MRTLVVYFSRSGHTQQMAKEIAERCGADLEAIREEDSRTGFWGYWRSAWDVLTRAESPIRATTRNPAHYDRVIIGTPIWIGQPAPPVRTYASKHASQFKQVAFFCTEGGRGDLRAFDELSRICGKTPVATLTVTERQLPVELHADQLNRFATRMSA